MARPTLNTIGLALGAVAVMTACLAIQYGAATRDKPAVADAAVASK